MNFTGMTSTKQNVWRTAVASLCFTLLFVSSVRAAESKVYQEADLIQILQSETNKAEKAITCKRLAIYGTEKAVPVLAPLLADGELTSWARIALEAIPGPAADKALREAIPQLQGRVLVGTINSIGVRRDPQAVPALAGKLTDSDAQVACAAAESLGRIGGPDAAKALNSALAGAPAETRGAIAEGCIRCAESFAAEHKRSQAVALYDAVRQAEVPKQRLLEATRGAILARGSAGLPLLLEQLRSSDKDFLAIGLRTARELPGGQVTRQLAVELDKADAARQPLLLLALADRNDPAAMPVIYRCARTGGKKLRLTAVAILDRLNQPSSLTVLLEVAADPDKDLAQAAKAAVARLPGEKVDKDLLARMAKSSGQSRQILFELAGRRDIQPAIPQLMVSVSAADPAVRNAALQALGNLGGSNEVAILVKRLGQVTEQDDRAEIEKTLVSICGRCGASCVRSLVPLARNRDNSLRIIALHVLAATGGSEALRAIYGTIQDSDEAVQDEAVRTLSTWPNTWPEDETVAEPLLYLARDSRKASYQILAMRGYLQFLQGDKKLKRAEKVERVKEAQSAIRRPEEKRLAISVIDNVPGAATLDLLMQFAEDPAVSEDACSALTKAADRKAGATKEQRKKALELVVAKCANEETKKEAQKILESLE